MWSWTMGCYCTACIALIASSPCFYRTLTGIRRPGSLCAASTSPLATFAAHGCLLRWGLHDASRPEVATLGIISHHVLVITAALGPSSFLEAHPLLWSSSLCCPHSDAVALCDQHKTEAHMCFMYTAVTRHRVPSELILPLGSCLC